eukprot:3941729-Rhodomonas_salina.1
MRQYQTARRQVEPSVPNRARRQVADLTSGRSGLRQYRTSHSKRVGDTTARYLSTMYGCTRCQYRT